ncbi:RNA polymerase sigma factor, sigma-70 family [Singulisphaera sp. GP187]|uniref:sigma-70 family RNA polymerase sigma factor n=1 Tax=Singulisphaera sp. GP187 TaxID=1882752 RepID=UPI00092A2017|nr:sigma-70 family RNA polymerase sigma factor [Singulisphaera sp. GP187]SIO08819.1 RNA polymerase sigma factor, sigma-70 family [Singulisphaera sp. GP187]
MASAHQGAVLHQLGRLFGRGTVAGLSEWQLLSRYLNDRDEVAFEAIVARHGPMVLGVCRRLLVDPNDVDDAFQATFLVLVRRANSLGERDAIGHWLYGVAHRVALRARSEAAQRRWREPSMATPPVAPETDVTTFELGPLLDEELGRLPTKYRAPIVLCHLEGFTHEEAANQLQWPLGTVKGRLVRARELLKVRLIRRGLSLALALTATTLSRKSLAVVPETLRATTVATAMKVAAGPITAGMVSASVAALLEGVLTTMFWTKLRTTTAALLILGFLAGSVGVVAQPSNEERPAEPVIGETLKIRGQDDQAAEKAASSPAGHEVKAVERPNLDPERHSQAKSQSQLANQIFQEELRGKDDPAGAKLTSLIHWSKAILNDSNQTAAQRAEALSDHLGRMRTLREIVIRLEPSAAKNNLLLQVEYYQQEANQMLARAKTDSEGPVPGPRPGPKRSDEDPKSKALLEKLEEPIDMVFSDETPLEDILKHINSTLAGPKGKGIPIYVDPVGLQTAERTMTSPVTIDLKGVPLKTTLSLLLRQIGLAYKVKDGVLFISNEDDEDNPLTNLESKAERGELTPDEASELVDMLKTLNEIKKLKAEGWRLDQERLKPAPDKGGSFQ